MLKIRQSCDHLILNMGILIPGKDSLYIETGPRCLRHEQVIIYHIIVWDEITSPCSSYLGPVSLWIHIYRYKNPYYEDKTVMRPSCIMTEFFWQWGITFYIGGLVQERRNSIANALELRLSYTNPPIYRTWISNGIWWYSLGCNYLSMFRLSVPVTQVLISSSLLALLMFLIVYRNNLSGLILMASDKTNFFSVWATEKGSLVLSHRYDVIY